MARGASVAARADAVQTQDSAKAIALIRARAEERAEEGVMGILLRAVAEVAVGRC